MNRRIYECIYSYVPNAYMQTYLISRRSSLLFATFVVSVARAVVAVVVVAKTRAAAQSATCIVYLQVLWVLQPPSLPPSLTLLALIKLCVWVCLLLLLCTIVHSSSTVNYYYEPVPPFLPLSLSLSGDRRLFIYCCYQQILAMWKCYK